MLCGGEEGTGIVNDGGSGREADFVRGDGMGASREDCPGDWPSGVNFVGVEGPNRLDCGSEGEEDRGTGEEERGGVEERSEAIMDCNDLVVCS